MERGDNDNSVDLQKFDKQLDFQAQKVSMPDTEETTGKKALRKENVCSQHMLMRDKSLIGPFVLSPSSPRASFVPDSFDEINKSFGPAHKCGLLPEGSSAADPASRGTFTSDLGSKGNRDQSKVPDNPLRKEIPAPPLTQERGRSSRRRKGKRLISRSAHWIETQQMTGGLYAHVSQDDMQLAAKIKLDRLSSGLCRCSIEDNGKGEADSDSSWCIKVASSSTSTAGLPLNQVHFPTSSVSLLSLAHRIGKEIGVDFGNTVAGMQSMELGVLLNENCNAQHKGDGQWREA